MVLFVRTDEIEVYIPDLPIEFMVLGGLDQARSISLPGDGILLTCSLVVDEEVAFT